MCLCKYGIHGRARAYLRCATVPLAVTTLLLGGVATAWAQGGATIQGRVVGPGGAPIGAVSVGVGGMNLEVFTDADGTYHLVIPAARVHGQSVMMVARRLGYKPDSVSINLVIGSYTQDFTLALNPLHLGEIVVTGAGTEQAAEKLGNVRNPVDSGLIRASHESNIVEALAGKAPNVLITQQSGEPGASSFVQIRGVKTIAGTGQPLIVVDGVPIDNSTMSTSGPTASTVTPNRASDLNPDDIANVEILKGAAAAAIYGARAGQGVVLITTKSGQPGPTRYSLRTSVSVDDVTNPVPLQHEFGQGVDGQVDTCGGPDCSVTPFSWGPTLTPGTTTFDHFDELFHTAATLDNTLTISGGNDRTLFYLSGSFVNQNGTMVGPNNSYDRTTLRLKASQQLSDNFTIGGNFSYADVRGDFIQKGSNTSGLLLGSLRTPPEFDNHTYTDPVTGLQRSYRFPEPSASSALESRGYDNPFFVLNRQANTSRVGRAFGNISLDYTNDWLTVNYTLGGDYASDERLEGLPQSSSTFPEGQVNRANLINYQIDQNVTATARYQLGDNVSGTVTAGQDLNSRNFRLLNIIGNTLISPEPFKLANTVDRTTPADSETVIHNSAFFGQATVELYHQLFLTGALRNDGSSTFGVSDRRAWFPKASLAWTFTSAMTPPSWLSFGKLRAAFGESGTEPLVYSTVSALSTGNLADGGWGPFLSPTQGGLGGIYSGLIKAQDDLKPERTQEIEGGIDLGLFADRADVGVTYYRDLSRNVILLVPLAPSTGFQFQAQNAAKIRNRGWELTMNVRPVTTRNVAWDIGLQWATNDNRVLDLQGADFVSRGAGTFVGATGAAVLGSRVGVLRGNDFARCGVTAGIETECGDAPTGALYIDSDGFPILDPEVRVIADPTPDWTGSVRTGIRFHGLRLSGLLDIKHGGQVWDGTRGALYHFGTHKDTEIRGETRTFGDDFFPGPVAGPGAGTPVTIDQDWFTGLGDGFGPVAAQFVEDGGFVKLREISLSYTLTGEWLRHTLGLSSIDLSVAGRNLHTWTSYLGIDPETNLGGAEVGQTGIDYFNNPQTRSIVFSVGLNR